jgi:hypothetical protein
MKYFDVFSQIGARTLFFCIFTREVKKYSHQFVELINNSKLNRPINRISLIALGSITYWVGYCGFFTHLQNPAYSLLSLFLIISGLWLAGTNSSNLVRGK